MCIMFRNDSEILIKQAARRIEQDKENLRAAIIEWLLSGDSVRSQAAKIGMQSVHAYNLIHDKWDPKTDTMLDYAARIAA